MQSPFAADLSVDTASATAIKEAHSHADHIDNRRVQTAAESSATSLLHQTDGEISMHSHFRPSNKRVKTAPTRVSAVPQELHPGDSSNVTTPSSTPNPTRLMPLSRTKTRSKLDRERQKAEKAIEAAEKLKRKKEEECDKKMTPMEYAVKLQSKFQSGIETKHKQFLKNKCIFYVGGDLQFASNGTREKMNFVSCPCLDRLRNFDAVKDLEKGWNSCASL